MGLSLTRNSLPMLLEGDDGIDKLAHLVRSYFKLDGHHIQFNVVTAETLRAAQASPEKYRDLIVRVQAIATISAISTRPCRMKSSPAQSTNPTSTRTGRSLSKGTEGQGCRVGQEPPDLWVADRPFQLIYPIVRNSGASSAFNELRAL